MSETKRDYINVSAYVYVAAFSESEKKSFVTYRWKNVCLLYCERHHNVLLSLYDGYKSNSRSLFTCMTLLFDATDIEFYTSEYYGSKV
jgi:hypothetical protein